MTWEWLKKDLKEAAEWFMRGGCELEDEEMKKWSVPLAHTDGVNKTCIIVEAYTADGAINQVARTFSGGSYYIAGRPTEGPKR